MKQAFSLVELSIVLVILGLLTGGILGGQSLIRAAELRAVSTEYQRYSAAIGSFRDKYFALPGDMTNATAFWGTTASCPSTAGTGTQTCNGDGNGTFLFTTPNETFRAWQQLANAGLVEGTYSGIGGSAGVHSAITGSNIPGSRLQTAGWQLLGQNYIEQFVNEYFPVNYQNFLAFGINTAVQNDWVNDPAIKAEEAWNIDQKSDDGNPSSGRILSFRHVRRPNCVVAADNAYDLANTSLGCNLFFITSY